MNGEMGTGGKVRFYEPLTRPTAGLLGWSDRHSDILMSQGDLTVVAVGRSETGPATEVR